MNLTCFFDRTIKTISVIFVVTMMTLIAVDRAVAGDYCLGDWTQTEQEYCDGHMMYIRALVADRDVGRPKAEVLAEAHKAAATYVMPMVLASNYVEYVYGNPKADAETLVAAAYGGCIDNYDVIIKQAKDELGIKE